MQEMKGYNSYYGCFYCYDYGEYIHSCSGVRYLGIDERKRTNESTLRDA